jgi:hypothetical protein
MRSRDLIQVGTVLIDDSPLISRLFGVETEAYSGNWSVTVVVAIESATLPVACKPSRESISEASDGELEFVN